MTNPIQENQTEKIMKKRKIPHEKSYEITKRIKQKTRSIYNVMHEHNYFHDVTKNKPRQPNEKEYLNYTEIITNESDKCNSIPEWCITISSSDEEDDIKDMPLSHILKLEFEKDILHEYKNNKRVNDLLPLNEDQMYNELNSTNNHDLSNISNGSNNIISESHVIDEGKQSKMKHILIPLTNDVIINTSLDSSNSLLVRKTHSPYNIIDLTKTVTSANNVRPPLQWIHLIYLAIKNSSTENLTCSDIERKVRYWFPYYYKTSFVKYINLILSHINSYCGQKYFHCNSFPILTDQVNTWTVNSNYIETLEESLMTVVENNEDEIKSAMAHPDQLSTIVNGYSILYLGCSQNSIKN